MKTTLIRIGNSQGFRIPKALIEQCGFEGEVETRAEGRSLFLSPARAPRQGRDAALRPSARSERVTKRNSRPSGGRRGRQCYGAAQTVS